jgi:hypothetical protein
MFMVWLTKTICLVMLLGLFLLSACTTIPVDERNGHRDQIDIDADETIGRLVNADPDFQKLIDASLGYFVSRVSATKIPIFGVGYGIGVLYDKESNSSTYMNIKRTDVGMGLGSGTFQVMILFKSREVLEEFRGGVKKFGAGAEWSYGTSGSNMSSASGEGYSIHILSNSGSGLVMSTRLVTLTVNEDLTDTGVSEIGIPNTGSSSVYDKTEHEPRIWNHSLPFFAQAVIDEGYDLPLPYGIGIVYANVTQDMLLTDLEVGINGRDQEPFDFVSFDNAQAQNDSLQLKIDTWLFPFMNVFALLGKIEGEAPLDVVLDGNEALSHLGVDCSAPGPPSPLCSQLQDQNVTLPITAPFSGKTYGLGFTLAGGWNNWFAAIPAAFTYADMNGTNTDGAAITVSPRVGRVFNLGRKGNLSLFAGGNYLDADLTITGRVSTPDELLVIDYTVEQKNTDQWNSLVGFNWDINRHISWTAEYNGFIGSREAFISSLVWRL